MSCRRRPVGRLPPEGTVISGGAVGRLHLFMGERPPSADGPPAVRSLLAFLLKIGFTYISENPEAIECGKDVLKRMSEYLSKLTPEQAREVPMVDLAFDVLKAANTPFYYRDLMAEVAKIKGFTDEEIMQVIAQLYTEINVDGRFACVGNNLWGLKRWYPVDNKEGEMGTSKRPRIINDDDDDLDEEEYLEEEEDTFVAEDDEFDAFDEDRDDLLGEEEEEVFAPDDAEEELEETDEIDEIDGELDEEEAEDSEFDDDLNEEDTDEDDDGK